jgi:hypothetical protein
MDLIPKGIDFIPKGMGLIPEGMNCFPKGIDFIPKGRNYLTKGIDFHPIGREFFFFSFLPNISSSHFVSLCVTSWLKLNERFNLHLQPAPATYFMI